MNAAKTALTRTKTFVTDHKVALAVTTTAVTCVVVHLKVIRNVNERLTEMGVMDEFYSQVS